MDSVYNAPGVKPVTVNRLPTGPVTVSGVTGEAQMLIALAVQYGSPPVSLNCSRNWPLLLGVTKNVRCANWPAAVLTSVTSADPPVSVP